MNQSDIQSLTSLLCHLVTYELEIKQVLEASDQESADFLDFRHDLAYSLGETIARNTATIQDQPTHPGAHQ